MADKGLQAYLVRCDDVVVLAFRGSPELLDWIGNFNFPLDDGFSARLPGLVHRCFSGAIVPICRGLESLVGDFSDRGQPLWITGTAWVELMRRWLPCTSQRSVVGSPFYSFGAPRAGDDGAYRAVHENDIFPRLPPTTGADNAAPIVSLAGHPIADYLRDLDYMHAAQMWWFESPSDHSLRPFASLDDGQDVPYWAEMADSVMALVAASRWLEALDLKYTSREQKDRAQKAEVVAWRSGVRDWPPPRPWLFIQRTAKSLRPSSHDGPIRNERCYAARHAAKRRGARGGQQRNGGRLAARGARERCGELRCGA